MKRFTCNVALPEMVAQMEREGIQLISSGSGKHFGNCPLCGDTETSMTVNDERQVFDCSLCGKGGKINTFIKHLKDMTHAQVANYFERQKAIDLAREIQEARKRALLDTEVI